MMSPEPLLVMVPKPAMPRAKMFGNIMELKKPASSDRGDLAGEHEENHNQCRRDKAESAEQLAGFDPAHHPGASSRPTSAPNQ